ncbi:DUF3237 domain-containing protein [Pseudomonas sp. App30]|uniref:DUF3237 domain-containing protein n=1 Tax=Pseudomonas sp. App30 TaxID=3068990 RepID=UPI003A810DA5
MSPFNANCIMLRCVKKTAGLVAALGLYSLMGLNTVNAAQGLTEIKPNRIGNELVMKINVKLGPPEDMGKGADGHRINYPIIGGTFVGAGMKGEVVPGGADMSVERDDGVTLVEALYRLKTDDGQIIIIHNAGIWRLNESGLAKQAKGLKLNDMKETDFYCRTVPSFKTQPGKYDWLSNYIFLGSIDGDGMEEVDISVYRINGI